MRKASKNLFVPGAAFLIFLSNVYSQEYPKYEIHGGYSYTHMRDRDWFGWQVSATHNINHYFGVSFNFLVLDASKMEFVFFREFKTDARRYYFLAGPKLTDRSWKKWIPYAHFLFGASKTAISYQYQLDESDDDHGSVQRGFLRYDGRSGIQLQNKPVVYRAYGSGEFHSQSRL